MTIDEIQDEVIAELSIFDDWMDKYNYLIELGNNLPEIDVKFKKEEFLIRGCQSRVWLNAELIENKVVFTADSDAIITKGIIGLLIRILSDRSPEEIIKTELYFIDKTGLRNNLSPTRSNGLVSMIKQMKLYAIAFQAKMKDINN